MTDIDISRPVYLWQLNIGDKFTIGKGKLIWVKDTVQGMNELYSYCSTIQKMQTKNPSRKSKWSKLFSQGIEVNLIKE